MDTRPPAWEKPSDGYQARPSPSPDFPKCLLRVRHSDPNCELPSRPRAHRRARNSRSSRWQGEGLVGTCSGPRPGATVS